MNEYYPLKNDIEDILGTAGNQDEGDEAHDRGILSRLTYDSNHVFPNAEDLLEISTQSELCFYRTVALILKGQWEKVFACEVNGWRPDNGQPLMALLAETQEHVIRGANFNPDTMALFEMLQQQDQMATQAGYGSEDFDTLIQQVILAGFHLVKNNGPEISSFAESETARIEMLRDSTPEEREAFWEARCGWTQTQNTLDSLHVQCENRRLQNAETKRRYLSVFGKYEIELQEATYRYCDLKRRKLLKEANPDVSEEQIAEMVAEEEERHKKRLSELKFLAGIAAALEQHPDGGMNANYDQIQEYRARAKTLLRQLKAKIHNDHLENDLAYQKLTEKQKEELLRMLHQALDISIDELGFPAGWIEHDMRSVPGLQSALARVDAILRNAGIDTRIELVIQGKTLKEQLSWLRETIKSLERRIESARAELHALATDPEVERMRQILACAEQHEKIRQEMKNKTREYTGNADGLAEALDKLFEKDRKDAA